MNDFALQDEIISCEGALLQAMQAGDAERLDELLHEDLLFNLPDGTTATKAMDLANYRSGGVSWEFLTYRDLTINEIDGDAVVAVTLQLKGNYMGAVIDGPFRYLRVWKRSSRGWQVIAGSVIPLAGA